MWEVYGDIETRSAVNLRDCGAYVYAIDPSTDVLCVAYAINDGEPELWLPPDPPPIVFLQIAREPNDWKLIAHNWDFERAILEHVLIPHYGFQPIPLASQHCSQRLALANAYPAELDLLAQALELPYRKDPEARKALLAVSRPMQRKGENRATGPTWNTDPAKLALVYDRCRNDVRTTRAVWQSPKLKHLFERERHYQLQDAVINGRGARLDRAFAAAGKNLAERERAAVNARLTELTAGGITSVDQTKRFLAVINARGHAMTTLNKRAVAQVLAHKPDSFVRELLELRRDGAKAAARKFQRMLLYASPFDDRMRGTLRMYGGAPGRWAGLGPQLQNLKKNESNLPLSVVDSIRTGERSELARFGNPLALLGDVSRAALCASPGMQLMSGDFSAVESVVLAWLAREEWKLVAFRRFLETGDVTFEPYRTVARRMLQRPEDADVNSSERQLGKAGELACGFGGSVGAWRRIVPHDQRSDGEIQVIIQQWRDAHPATRKFWRELAAAIRVTIRTGQPVLVARPPQPPITAVFGDGNLRLILPSARAITYPQARLTPSKFEDAPPDVEFMDNARGQWKSTRAWFGTFVENVVQGTARDLLAAAIERFETNGLDVVFHCHDEVTIEVPIGSLSDADFLQILLKLPEWATGLPLGGKVHTGPHYLAPPEQEAAPLAAADADTVVVETAIDSYLDSAEGDTISPDAEAIAAAADDDEITDASAPLTDLVELPLTASNKVCCPFHDEVEPSCAIYPDHFHCFGCGEHGGVVDWLVRVDGLSEAEAQERIKDWPGAALRPPATVSDPAAQLAFIKSIWTSAQPLRGSIGEIYLDRTRHIDVTKLPADIHRSLRFHPRCVFGPLRLPCLLALMRNPLTDQPTGIQRVALRENNGTIEKIERRTLGKAGVVKLWPPGPQLVCGEGLETTLAAATRIPFEQSALVPAWAALSSYELGQLPPIVDVKRLIILADHDAAGEAAADRTTARWNGAGRVVTTLKPEQRDTDFNDLVIWGDTDG